MPSDLAAPEGWSVERLANCVDVLDSRRKPVNSKERAFRPGPVPYYGATGQVGWIDDYLFNEELVLLGEDGAPFLDKSKPIAYIIDGKSWVNNHAHVLRARSTITSNRYIKYYLDWFDFTNYVQGSTRYKLTQGAMNSIPVLLAPRPVQDELVAIFDSLATRRAKAATHFRTARKTIERYRQAVLAAACSGRLTIDWRDVHGGTASAQGLADRIDKQRRARLGRRYTTRAPSTMPEEELPTSWCWTTVGTLVDVATGATPLRKRQDYYGGSIPWVTSGAVNAGLISEPTEYITDLAIRETNAKVFPIGTLLVAMYGEGQTRGRVGELAIPAATNQAVAALLFDEVSTPLRPYFKLFFLENYERIRSLSFGGVQPNLSLGAIRDTPLPLPPQDEQEEIVRRVNQLLQLATALERRISQASQSLERSSQAVLVKTFRGELITNGEAVPATEEA